MVGWQNSNNGMDITSTAKLDNGVEMPYLGLGTWNIRSTIPRALTTAFEAGYRHIDTASIYGNQRAIGNFPSAGTIPRQDLFITSKVWNSDHGYRDALQACDQTLHALQTDYIDLYLIHWPSGGKLPETWQALEELYEQGKCRAIGVSNFSIRHIEEVWDGSNTKPMVNQVELHPFNYGRMKQIIDYCQQNGIFVTAYSPLNQGRKLNHKKLTRIAHNYGKSTAQVLLRWGLQHDFIEIPKSDKPDHIYANADIFDFTISADDMATLDSI